MWVAVRSTLSSSIPWIHVALLTSAAAIGCSGLITEPGAGDGPNGSSGPGGASSASSDLTAISGLRRLTVKEYADTIRQLVGDDAASSEQLLPTDPRLPFDNDYENQEPSKALIQGTELLADDIVGRLLDDSARLASVVDCTPAGPEDTACFEHFVRRFGRLAFRRSLDPEEVTRFMGAQELSKQRGDFYEGVGVAVRAFLQDPNFLYRVEFGTAIPGKSGLYRLAGPEVATRLSYLLWGVSPDSALLDKAETGGLDTSKHIRAVAKEMLEDPRARQRMQRFHAMWIGYEKSGGGALGAAMQQETEKLIERVVFGEKAAWTDLFRAEDTFVTSELAAHYELEQPSDPDGAWVKYANSGRQGLLSHGSFLGVGTEGEDTSPTLRGVMVLERLLCETVPPPPSSVVVKDLPAPAPGSCKIDRFKEHAQEGCNSCHDRTDPIGFGLEAYDMLGKKRDHEPNAAECKISGQGSLLDEGSFNGPGELSALIAKSNAAAACRVTQLYRFTTGRAELDSVDDAFVQRSVERVGRDASLQDLILEIVSSPEFVQRREAAEGK